MTRRGKARAGFSLMEILMAVGILGVGMTMVASVFPVAVDQSRRSRDLTMAALSARSVAAALRARRQEAVDSFRRPDGQGKTFDASAGGKTPKTGRLSSTALPTQLRCYNPWSFLYDDSTEGGGGGAAGTKSPREYRANVSGMYSLWNAGSYVPVVFATPISNDPKDDETKKAGHGPWRITIMIYKSRGERPDYLALNPSASWVWTQNPGKAGSYVMDWRFKGATDQPNNRGEAYKVQRCISLQSGDRVVPAVAFLEELSPGSLRFRAFVAGGDQTQGTNCWSTTDSIPSQWVSLPGAIAAYHTVLGD